MITKRMFVWAALVVASAMFAAGCSDDVGVDGSIYDAMEVKIAEAIAGLPEAGLTEAEVEERIRASIDDLASPEEGISRAEMLKAIEDAIAGEDSAQPTAEGGDAESDTVSIPPKSDPAAYTRYLVESAIARYDAEGLDATLAHYNSPDSVDGQWYVFIIDRNAELIGHYDPERLGLSVLGFVGTDINGYTFGPEMLAADETGRWVPYVYVNPAAGTLGDAGAFELKNAWVLRHEGLLFGSGWYINTEQFLPALILESVPHFRTGGIEAILAFFNDPQGISAGLIPTVQYYNRTDTLGGYFSGFIAAPDGQILTHIDPRLIRTDIEELLGPAVRNATPQGAWITAAANPAGVGPDTMRIWVVDVDGTLIGGGWYSD